MSALDYRFDNPRILEYAGGYTDRIRYGALEANSQSFKAGQFIYLNAGAVTAVASDGVIHGIAQKDATNVTSGNVEIPYIEINANDVIAIRVTNGGTDTANTTPIKGAQYGLYVASNKCYLDIADTSNDRFRFLEVLDIGGEQSGGYWCKATVLPEALATAAD